jgi:hypothetical protein
VLIVTKDNQERRGKVTAEAKAGVEALEDWIARQGLQPQWLVVQT